MGRKQKEDAAKAREATENLKKNRDQTIQKTKRAVVTHKGLKADLTTVNKTIAGLENGSPTSVSKTFIKWVIEKQMQGVAKANLAEDKKWIEAVADDMLSRVCFRCKLHGHGSGQCWM